MGRQARMGKGSGRGRALSGEHKSAKKAKSWEAADKALAAARAKAAVQAARDRERRTG